ncbi:unnamed protein product, partial [marine sediment metagenome]
MMFKKIFCLIVALVFVSSISVCVFSQETAGGKTVKLVFTSWRTEDIERMNRINAVFTKKNPNIIINFQPIKDTEYDTQLTSSLETGVGADIIYLRSYDPGK